MAAAAAAAAGAGAGAGAGIPGIPPVTQQEWMGCRLFTATGVPGMASQPGAAAIATAIRDAIALPHDAALAQVNRLINKSWHRVDPVNYAAEAVYVYHELCARGAPADDAASVFSPLHALMSRRLGYLQSDDFASQAAVRAMASDFKVDEARALLMRIVYAYAKPYIPLPPVFRNVAVFATAPNFALRVRFRLPADFASELLGTAEVGDEQRKLWEACDYACVEVSSSTAEDTTVKRAYIQHAALKAERVAAALPQPLATLAPLIVTWLLP